MKPKDQNNIADLYEEGIWDRMKAGAAGIAGGVGGMKIFGGQGYAQGAQDSKKKSLMKSFTTKMLNDIKTFEADAANFNEPKVSKDLLFKTKKMTNLLTRYNS
jgi:hypothetical protein